jgi:hypothetical protein
LICQVISKIGDISSQIILHLGITRNPIAGQSKTIHKDIVELIENYIKPETAIVLHVIPASVDFTTSESIQISKKHDPTGKNI